jgi:photosystem II stability/assembly factor-like uncharacterized protein
MNKKYALVTVCILILAFQACSNPSPTPVSEPTKTATAATSTSTPISTVTPTSTSTPIPLAWAQVYDGQDFERDMVSAFATDKKDPNVIYAGMKNSGVYKTVDGGISWLSAHDGLVNMQVESLLIDSESPLILYAGTLDGIFKTEDGGENWSRIGEGIYLLMDMQDNSHLYARDENTIYETTDQGNTWNTAYSLKKDCPDTISSWAIHPTDGDMLFIGGGEACAGVYQSSDSGRNWTLIGLEDKPNLNAIGIGLDEQGNFSVYTYFRSSVIMAESGIYFSYDGGANWSHVILGCDILASDPDNPATIYCAGSNAGSNRLSVIHKKGDDWQHFPSTNSTVLTAVHINHTNGTDRIITSGINDPIFDPEVGVFISTNNGSEWTESNNGIGAARSELEIDPMNTGRMYLATNYDIGSVWDWGTGGCRLYRAIDGGKIWSSIRVAGWCGPSFDSANAFYLIEKGSYQKSWDGGGNWLWTRPDKKYKVKDGEWNERLNKLAIYELPAESQSISANPYTDNLIYAVGNTIYYWTGSGWQLSEGSEGLWDGRLFYNNQSKMIFAIGRYHQKYSTDNGMTWQACGEDVTASQSDSRLAFDLQGLRLYLATLGQGVLISTDKCGSWQESNNGLENLFVNTVAIDSNNPDIVYAGTDGGAYVSFDGSATWGQINDGLVGSTIVYSIAIDSESNVYAATPNGIFKLEGR